MKRTSYSRFLARAAMTLLAVLCCLTGARADVVEIGNPEVTTNNQYLPGYNYYKYSLTQQIYTADEIGMAGTINSIAFKNTGAEKTRTYNVYMLLTDKETFSNSTDWVAMSDDDLVFSGSLTFTVGEWTTIELDTPFAYDGSSNLLVGVADVTGEYSSSPHMTCLVFDATGQAIRAYRDANAYDITAPGANGSLLNVKNQIQLDITPSGTAVCYKPTLAVSGITHTEATLTVGGGSGTYNVQYKAANATDWTDVVTNTTETTFTLNGLTPLTTYEVQVQSVCDGGATSDWRTTSFSTTAIAEAVGDAWSDDFEGASCGWELVNGEIDNAWVWGSATTNGGSHALYISNDGGTTNAYTVSSAAMVYATKLLNFTEGKYEFSYDWVANGESSWDFLRVVLVPASLTLTAGTSLPSGLSATAVPTGWIALDGGSKLNLVTEWQNKAVAVDVPAGNYYLVLAWRDDTSSGNQPPAAVDNVSITRISCEYDVTDLAVDDITTNSAILTWTAGEATQWQVVYADNASFENATEAIVSEATYTMTGLQPASTYYAKVRVYCGGEDFGGWSTVTALLTECVAITDYPYTENFDSYTAASGFLPVCWNRINTGTSYNNYPYVNGYSSHSASNCLYFYSKGSSSTTDISDQYAILPPMEDLAGKQISLFAKGYNSQSTFTIGTMTDPSDVTTFTEIATQELTTSYQEFIYDVPATATDNYIAIMMKRPNESNSVTRDVYIDDITIDFPPTCPKPMGLTVTANSQTAHGATVTWTEKGEATQWIVEFATDNEFTDVQSETVDDNPTYTFQGLDSETTYYVRVKAQCSPNDESAYSNVVNFTTTIPCPAPTGFAVADLSGYTATLNWTGTSESYIVSYRTAAYTDGLDETFTGSGIPTDWENKVGLLSDVMEGTTTLSTGSQWNFGKYNGVFDQHAKINIYGQGDTKRHGWLISPAFTVVDNASLNFDLALTAYSGTLGTPQDTGTDDKFVVLIYTDDEATWTILRQWDNEEGSTYVYNDINSTATGEHVSIDLSSYAGQSVRIAFYGESTESNADNNLHIDNVGCGIYHAAGQWQTVTVDEAPAILTGLIPETAYQAKLQGNCGDYDGLSEETGIVNFTTLNTCPVPTDLTVDNDYVTATTADLSWHGSIDVDSYTVRYRVPEHIEGGINETFEATSIPWGWTIYTGLLSSVMEDPTAFEPTTFAWSFGTSNGVFDSHARVNIYSNSQKWLVTPAFTLASSTFTFDLALTAYSGTNVPAPATTGTDDKFVVLISTDNMETWTILRQWDNEEGSTYVYNDIANTAEGEQVSIDLSDYVGQNVCIAFYGESTASNADNNLHIDNVVIGNPTVVPDSEWLTAETATTNVSLTGLTPETTYEAQVKSTCSDPEEWSNVVSFTTPVFTGQTNTYALTVGENWVSFNIETTLDDLKAALVAVFPYNNITINSQSGGWAVYNDGQWRGSLNTLDYFDVAQMYMINVPDNCEITLKGMPIDPAEHPITICPYYNWIGFPLNESMTLTDAFAGFAINSDQIISKRASASYNRGRWLGQLTTLEPGKGYIYSSAQSDNRTLVFPTSAKAASGSRSYSDHPETHWADFNFHQYQYNQPLVAAIQIDGTTIDCENGNWTDFEVAAFVGDDCRGHAFLEDRYVEDDIDPYPVIEMPVYYDSSEEGAEVTFKLYDHATGTEYDTDVCIPSTEIITGDSHVEYNSEDEAFVSLNFILSSTTDLVLNNDDSEMGDDEKNTALISNAVGQTVNVTLQDRTLFKDGHWNTLCLPFDMDAGQVMEQLNPIELKELDLYGTTDGENNEHQTGLEGTTLYLVFKDADEIQAGVPYIIKWDEDEDLVSPVFYNVTIPDTYTSADAIAEALNNAAVTFNAGKFVGTYSSMSFTAEDKSILFLGSNNTLYYPQPADEQPVVIGAFRAYFELDTECEVRSFVLNFGDHEETGITTTNFTNDTNETWYSVNGVKFDNKPTRKGLYIQNRRKVVIK